MKRRRLLSAVVMAGAGLLAGCTEAGDGGGDGTPTDSPSPTETPPGTPTETRTESPTESRTDAPTESPTHSATQGSNRMTDRSFDVTDRGCGSGENRASVERGDDSVVVEGTIRGRNTCYTAELERAVYDADADELAVDVRSYEHHPPDETPACGQCITDIDYRATFEFDEGTPGEVTVRHNGEHVTSE